MIVQPRQRNVQRFLQVIRLASVPVRAPKDIDLFGDRVPRHFVFVVLVANVAVSVIGHDVDLADWTGARGVPSDGRVHGGGDGQAHLLVRVVDQIDTTIYASAAGAPFQP